jgi:hypothetical protein
LVSIEGNTLSLSAIDDEGKVFDELSLGKTPSAPLPELTDAYLRLALFLAPVAMPDIMAESFMLAAKRKRGSNE